MLDTDVASYVIKRSDKAVLSRLRATAVSDVCISVITEAELLFEVEVSTRHKRDHLAVATFLRYVGTRRARLPTMHRYGQR